MSRLHGAELAKAVLLGLIALIALAAIFGRRVTHCPFTMCAELARSDLAAIGHALENYASDHMGNYPTELRELVDGRDGYLKWPWAEIPTDPWKRPYIYDCNASGRGWRLTCYGSDGKPGGSGDAGDLSVESK